MCSCILKVVIPFLKPLAVVYLNLIKPGQALIEVAVLAMVLQRSCLAHLNVPWYRAFQSSIESLADFVELHILVGVDWAEHEDYVCQEIRS